MPLYFVLYNLTYFSPQTLLPSSLAINSLSTAISESPLHFYPLTLYGDTYNTL